MMGIGSEEGTLNRTSIVRFAENSILRSRKNRKSGGSEDSVQYSLLGYGFYVS